MFENAWKNHSLIFSFSACPHVSNVLRDQWVQMGRGGSLDKKRTSRRIFRTSGRMGISKDHLSNVSHSRRQNAAQISLKMFSGQISNRDANTSVAKSKLKSEKSLYPRSKTPDLWMNWGKNMKMLTLDWSKGQGEAEKDLSDQSRPNILWISDIDRPSMNI